MTDHIKHDELVKAAAEAITKVGDDTSVPPETNIESLEELQASIESILAGLYCDIERSKP